MLVLRSWPRFRQALLQRQFNHAVEPPNTMVNGGLCAAQVKCVTCPFQKHEYFKINFQGPKCKLRQNMKQTPSKSLSETDPVNPLMLSLGLSSKDNLPLMVRFFSSLSPDCPKIYNGLLVGLLAIVRDSTAGRRETPNPKSKSQNARV